MDLFTFRLLQALMFTGVLVLVNCLLIPKAVSDYLLWKKTEDPKRLSSFFANLIGIVFLIIVDFIIVIKTFVEFG